MSNTKLSEDLIDEIYNIDFDKILELGEKSKNFLENTTLDLSNGLNLKGKFNQIPEGTIVAWSATKLPLNIPDGWVLCDGSHNTPNLGGRFIYGGEKTINGTGGSETHKLTVNEMPSHNHGGSKSSSTSGGHTHNLTKSGKTGTSFPSAPASYCNTGGKGWCNTYKGGRTSTYGIETDSKSNGSNHSISMSNTGGSRAHNNMPPYFVLAFIMKKY